MVVGVWLLTYRRLLLARRSPLVLLCHGLRVRPRLHCLRLLIVVRLNTRIGDRCRFLVRLLPLLAIRVARSNLTSRYVFRLAFTCRKRWRCLVRQLVTRSLLPRRLVLVTNGGCRLLVLTRAARVCPLYLRFCRRSTRTLCVNIWTRRGAILLLTWWRMRRLRRRRRFRVGPLNRVHWVHMAGELDTSSTVEIGTPRIRSTVVLRAEAVEAVDATGDEPMVPVTGRRQEPEP